GVALSDRPTERGEERRRLKLTQRHAERLRLLSDQLAQRVPRLPAHDVGDFLTEGELNAVLSRVTEVNPVLTGSVGNRRRERGALRRHVNGPRQSNADLSCVLSHACVFLPRAWSDYR